MRAGEGRLARLRRSLRFWICTPRSRAGLTSSAPPALGFGVKRVAGFDPEEGNRKLGIKNGGFAERKAA
jgi:hypothetical protein